MTKAYDNSPPVPASACKCVLTHTYAHLWIPLVDSPVRYYDTAMCLCKAYPHPCLTVLLHYYNLIMESPQSARGIPLKHYVNYYFPCNSFQYAL